MREQREYRYRLQGNDCTRKSEAGCVDGSGTGGGANESDDENEDKYKNKNKDKNKDRDRDKNKNKDKSKWLTSKGFQYPALKTKKEEMTHPKRPPESTIENLRKPWYDIFLPCLPPFLPLFSFLYFFLFFFLPSFLLSFFFPLTVLFFLNLFFFLRYLLFLSCFVSVFSYSFLSFSPVIYLASTITPPHSISHSYPSSLHNTQARRRPDAYKEHSWASGIY